jgi:hypothetical protein
MPQHVVAQLVYAQIPIVALVVVRQGGGVCAKRLEDVGRQGFGLCLRGATVAEVLDWQGSGEDGEDGDYNASSILIQAASEGSAEGAGEADFGERGAVVAAAVGASVGERGCLLV